jgi:hypothetical protein
VTTAWRIGVAFVILIAASAAIVGLTSLGVLSEGPLGASLERASALVESLEQRARERFVGPGRRRSLSWFEPARTDPGRLRTPDTLLLGAYDGRLPHTLEGIVEVEQAIDTTLPLIHFYTAWGDAPENRFPLRLVTAVWNLGSVPVVTWEPWLSAFDNVRHPFLPLREDRDLHGLAAVARGDYDFYVDVWAAEAARFGQPLFVRFAHEMNDPYRYPWGPQHNSKEEFIAAWRHVVDRFRRAGATNVIWVWSPHVAHDWWDLYYPGDAYADWVATGALNFGPIAQWSEWWSLDDILGTRYERLASFGRPVMIAEFGSLAVGGDRAGWYRDALTGLPERYPAVKAMLFFHAAADQTVTYQKVDWSFTEDQAVRDAIAGSLASWQR